jgi:hypothetical protein
VKFEHAKQVKARHEHELLMLDFVQGVGLGEEHGEPAITVYVDQPPAGNLAQVPERLEDVPVVVEQSGLFRTY